MPHAAAPVADAGLQEVVGATPARQTHAAPRVEELRLGIPGDLRGGQRGREGSRTAGGLQISDTIVPWHFAPHYGWLRRRVDLLQPGGGFLLDLKQQEYLGLKDL